MRQPDLFDTSPAPPRCGEIEAWAAEQGHSLLVGLDEAGRGPLAGPVVAAAVSLPVGHELEGLDDSKKLSSAARDRLFLPIQETATAWAIAVVEAEEIDRLNILQASLVAMGRAWEDATSARPELRGGLALVDGNMRAHLPPDVRQRPVIKGDARSTHIAAASILAKVTRDRLMADHHERWPMYGFDRHKGYPTAAHAAALREHGPCPIHRRSFRLPGQEDG